MILLAGAFNWKLILVIIGAVILVYGMCIGPKSSGNSQNNKNNGTPQNKNVGPREKKPLAHDLRAARDPDYYKKYFEDPTKKNNKK